MAKSKKPSILVIENDAEYRRLLEVVLRSSGFSIQLTKTGDEGIAQSRLSTPDLIILDIDNLEGDVLGIVQQLQRFVPSPIIILSIGEREEDVVGSLEGGADDFIAKPFRTRELIARSRVALRRRNGDEDQPSLTFGYLTVDFRARMVWKGDVEVRLTPTEYALLLLLIRNAGKVLTHRYILEHVWGAAYAEKVEYLRVYAGHLRKKLGDDPASPKLILNARNVGYRWTLKPRSMESK